MYYTVIDSITENLKPHETAALIDATLRFQTRMNLRNKFERCTSN